MAPQPLLLEGVPALPGVGDRTSGSVLGSPSLWRRAGGPWAAPLPGGLGPRAAPHGSLHGERQSQKWVLGEGRILATAAVPGNLLLRAASSGGCAHVPGPRAVGRPQHPGKCPTAACPASLSQLSSQQWCFAPLSLLSPGLVPSVGTLGMLRCLGNLRTLRMLGTLGILGMLGMLGTLGTLPMLAGPEDAFLPSPSSFWLFPMITAQS